ncbi:diacylglycerol kinase [unidentified eubacterium SCB49]|nr:diacylglycerol kinase [unidentified eubacterium SCB49]
MKKSFIATRIKGGYYAAKGAFLLLKNEASIQVQFVLAVLITAAGFYFKISNTEWMFQIFAIGLVMASEGLNTAAEEIANFVHPDFHDKIGYIKDIAAGAVFFAAIAAVLVGCIIYIPKLGWL